MIGRRSFLGSMGFLAAGTAGLSGCAGVRETRISNQTGGRPLNKPSKSTVYLRTGNDRFKNIYDALSPLRDRVAENIGVDGPDYRNHIIKYRLNKNIAGQIAWIDRHFER